MQTHTLHEGDYNTMAVESQSSKSSLCSIDLEKCLSCHSFPSIYAGVTGRMTPG